MGEGISTLFKQLTHGVYVVGVSDGKVQNAFTAAWIMQAAFEPLLLAVSIGIHHASYAILKQGRAFSVNVLSKEQLALARHFGGPSSSNKLATVAWHKGETGAPILDDALAYFDLVFSQECQAGDHAIVIGRVVDGAILHPERMPMNYLDTGTMDGSRELYPDTF